jgi:hypothetical protein
MIRAYRDGLRRVLSAPAIVAAVLITTLLTALPLGLALRGMIRAHLGESLAADSAAASVNYDWWQEFSAQASGVGTTFTPAIIGFAAVLDNLSSFADNVSHAIPLVAAATACLLVWAFLTGGILDRYARRRRTRAHEFFAACGVFFFRFLRLGALMWIVYYLMYAYVHPLLFERLYAGAIADVDVERTAFLYRLLLYLVFGAGLALWNMIFDYAKVRAIVEDRRSMAGAVFAAGRFVAHHPLATAGLYLLNVVAFLIVILFYALVAPGVGGDGFSMWAGFAIAQLYLMLRVIVKLTFWSSEIALFQKEVAHAAYTAAPLPVWPDSPEAEALSNAVR